MIFLAPFWLFAVLAILVPIAIHLWNKRPGKTVKVGSLRWLQASASSRWRSIRLHDTGLLALRCLILILLAAALAQLTWVHRPENLQSRKTVFAGDELLYTSAIQSIKPTIDALLQRGYTLRRYTSGFEQITQEQWQQISNNPADSILVKEADYWGLLPALARKYNQPQDSIWLFTSDQQRFFAGSRPATLPKNIRWIPVATQAQTRWLQAATQLTEDSLQLLLGYSNRNAITYEHLRVANHQTSINAENIQLQRQGDTLKAILAGNSTSKVKVQTKPLTIAIHYDEAQQPELRYLQAALHAIGKYTGQPVEVSAAATTQPDTTADWVFWLRPEAVPQQVTLQVEKDGLQLWVQPATKPMSVKTMLAAAQAPVAIHQLSARHTSKSNATLWTTTSGEPLLTVQPTGHGNIYYFRGGFSPAWGSLGQSAQFPGLLLPLLFPQPEAAGHDVRALDEWQLKPATSSAANVAGLPQRRHQNLLPWLVAAAALLFIIERIMAGRRSKV